MATPEIVEIKVSALAHLFSPLDPSPLPSRDLARGVEDHLVSWVRELPHGNELQINVYAPPDAGSDPLSTQIAPAMKAYFGTQADMADREMRELFRNGRRYLAVGLPLLVICLAASQLVRQWLGAGAASQLISESLIILPWVANWKPIELFLYDWWPIRRKRNLFKRLQEANVTLKSP